MEPVLLSKSWFNYNKTAIGCKIKIRVRFLPYFTCANHVFCFLYICVWIVVVVVCITIICFTKISYDLCFSVLLTFATYVNLWQNLDTGLLLILVKALTEIKIPAWRPSSLDTSVGADLYRIDFTFNLSRF
jgi:ABC-type proline/glycine betaine transport system permease subunit